MMAECESTTLRLYLGSTFENCDWREVYRKRNSLSWPTYIVTTWVELNEVSGIWDL
jgi:hypothetical protein